MNIVAHRSATADISSGLQHDLCAKLLRSQTTQHDVESINSVPVRPDIASEFSGDHEPGVGCDHVGTSGRVTRANASVPYT